MNAGLSGYANRVLALGGLLWLLSIAWGAGQWPACLPMLWIGAVATWAEIRSPYVPGFGVINFGEGFYVGVCLRYGGAAGSLLAGVAGLMADCARHRDRRVMRFNLGWALTTFTLVGWLATPFQPENPLTVNSLFWLVVAALAYGLCAGGLQAGCQNHMEGLRWGQSLRHQVHLCKLSVPSAAFLGLLAQSLLGSAAWSVVMLLFPIELLGAYLRVQRLHGQLVEAQAQLQAQSRQAALGMMAAGIAHEINNPLGAMATCGQLMQRMQLPDKAAPCLDIILKAVDRCQSVTARMLTYARGQSDSGGPSRLQEAALDARLFVQARLSKAALGGLEELSDAPSLACSPGALVQILCNLVTNAADSGASQIGLEYSLEGEWVEIRCRDNGCGIEKAAAERIFEPFFTTKEVGHGTGLGLSLSQGLASSAGGSLTLESTSRKGSTFVLRLRQSLAS